MKRKKKGGLSNLAISAIWFLAALGVVLAAFQALGATSVEDAMGVAKDRAVHYSECIPSGECGIISIIRDIGSDGSSGGNSNNPGSGSNSGSDNNSGGSDDSDIPGGQDEGSISDGNERVTRDTRGYRGPQHGEPYVNNAGLVTKNSAILMLEEITVSESQDVDYDRSEWRHWTGTEGRACWNTREEVLHRDATPGTVVYVDRQLNAVENYEDACAIGTPIEEDGKVRIDTENSGSWVDPYSGRTVTSSSDLDIDHIVPLSYAAENGGQSWSEDLKETFANDLDNLLATSARENRRKGAKGPSDYMPPYKGYRCQYAKSFTGIINKYELSMPEDDVETLVETLEGCQF